VEVPVALASDEERLASKSFDALEPHELAHLYQLMSRLQIVTPARRTRRYEKGATVSGSICGGRCAAACARAATRSALPAGAGA